MGIGTLQTGTWLAGVAQLLDEHHLAVLADEDETRGAFARALASHLRGFPATQVVTIPGRRVRSLEQFALVIGGSLGLGGSRPPFTEVLQRLRCGSARVRRRFLIWSDADELLEADVACFSRIVNALFAVAAEHEYLSPEPLVLHRVVFTGAHKLGAYAEEESGQFHAWLPAVEGLCGSRGEVFDCQSGPRVLTYRLDG